MVTLADLVRTDQLYKQNLELLELLLADELRIIIKESFSSIPQITLVRLLQNAEVRWLLNRYNVVSDYKKKERICQHLMELIKRVSPHIIVVKRVQKVQCDGRYHRRKISHFSQEISFAFGPAHEWMFDPFQPQEWPTV